MGWKGGDTYVAQVGFELQYVAKDDLELKLPYSHLLIGGGGIAGTRAPNLFCAVLRIEPRTSCVLGKPSTNRVTPQPLGSLFMRT